jgi:hypothetical protein
VLHAYQLKVFEGAIKNPRAALTGPLVRGDQVTIDHHLEKLDPLKKELYLSFVRLFQNLNSSTSVRGDSHEHTGF